MSAAAVTEALTKIVSQMPFASAHARSDAVAKLAPAFEAQVGPDGLTTVREVGSGRALVEAVPERLSKPEYAHFLAGAPTPNPPGWVQAQTDGEKAYAHWLAQHNAQRQAGYSPGIGLSFAAAAPVPELPRAPEPSGPPPIPDGFVAPRNDGEAAFAAWYTQKAMREATPGYAPSVGLAFPPGDAGGPPGPFGTRR